MPDAGVFESPEKVRALGRNPVVVVIGEIALRGYPEPHEFEICKDGKEWIRYCNK